MKSIPSSWSIYLVILTAFILAGCNIAKATIITTETKHVVHTDTSTVSTPIKSVTFSPDPTFSPIPTITPVRSKSTSAKSYPTVIPTAASTLTEMQEGYLALELLKTNSGCKLPCWWGFTPGETNRERVSSYFLSLGKTPELSENNEIPVRFYIPDNIYIFQYFKIEADVIQMIRIYAITQNTWSGELLFGNPQFIQAIDQYLLANIFSRYGKPSRILLYHRPSNHDPGSVAPDYELILYYSSQSIMVHYEGKSTNLGKSYQLCSTNIAAVNLWLWPNESRMSLEEVYAMLPLYSGIREMHLGYKSLKEATELDIDTFYKNVGQKDTEFCFETPTEIWDK